MSYVVKNYSEYDKWVVNGELNVGADGIINMNGTTNMNGTVNIDGKLTVHNVDIPQLYKAMSGNLFLSVSPAICGSSAAAVATAIAGDEAKFTRIVQVELVDAEGNIHNWFNGTFAVATVEITVGDGTCAIANSDTSVTLVNGVGTITLEYIGTWAAADTQTLTVTGGTKLGYTIANKTSVDTLIA